MDALIERRRAWLADIVARKDAKAGPDEHGQYPVLVLVQLGDVDGLKILLDAGADPNLGNVGLAQLFSPLGIAIKQKRRDAALLLLDHGASVHEPERQGDSVLALAIRERLDDVAQAIVDAAQHRQGFFAMVKASQCRWIDASLSQAAFEGSAVWCRKLIDLGANPNAPYLGTYLPIQMAAISGDVEAARTLLDSGAMPSAVFSKAPGLVGGSALLQATRAHKSGPAMIRLLLDRGAQAELTQIADSLLSSCAEGGSVEKLRMLLEAGGLVASQSMGSEPLALAIQHGRAGAVQVFLTAGVQPGKVSTHYARGSVSTHLELAESLAKIDPKPERDEIVKLLKSTKP